MYEYEIDQDKTVRIYFTQHSDDGSQLPRVLFLEQFDFSSKAKATEFAKAETVMLTNLAAELKELDKQHEARLKLMLEEEAA